MVNYSVNPRINPLLPDAPAKYFACPQVVKVLNIDELAEHIAMHGSKYNQADIYAVTIELVNCIREQLLLGNKVSLGKLGSFAITLNSTGATTREKFTEDRINSVNVRWTPGNKFKDLILEAQFKKVASRIAQAAVLGAETDGDKTINLGEIKAEAKEKRK